MKYKYNPPKENPQEVGSPHFVEANFSGVSKAKREKVQKKVEEEVIEISEPVTETRQCVECQGDGKWDGVICKVCKGSGKIFKDGTVVSTQEGTFLFKGGKLIKQ